jgi:general secretion pathway protein G
MSESAEPKPRGFTLIELLVVLGIVGVLTGIAIPTYSAYVEEARNLRVIIEIKMLQEEIANYQTKNGNLPNSLDDIGRGSLADAWGNPYRYLNFATEHGVGRMRKDRFLVPLNTDYDLYSMGRDGRSQTPLTAAASRDDIIRANNGEFIGPASAY